MNWILIAAIGCLVASLCCQLIRKRGCRCNSHTQQINELEKELKNFMSILDDLKNSVERLEKEQAETAANTGLVRTAVIELQNVIVTLQARLAGLEGQIDPSLPGELAALKARVDVVSSNLNTDQVEAGTIE